MPRSMKELVLILALSGAGGMPAVGLAWTLVLPDTVVVERDLATLGDLAVGPVPAQARDLVIRAGLVPNTAVTVSRQDILRRLVTAGLADNVRLSGSPRSQVVFAGHRVAAEELRREVRQAVQELVPAAVAGAPDSWFELDLPVGELSVADSWRIEAVAGGGLMAGRNLVPIRVIDEVRSENLTIVVVLHRFGEVARVRAEVGRNTPLVEEMFTWEWQDLAESRSGLAVGRDRLQGTSSVRALRPGEFLREADLQATPVILAGDTVELEVRRGQVAVTVTAVARQKGSLGQTIPVRNELTGRLVNARVTGPGRVEWRR